MKAAVLEDVAKLAVRTVPDPTVPPREVAIRVKAVGVCGTDLHIFGGHANYNTNAQGRPIPFNEQPQILGHEYAGEVVEVGREVKDLAPGDRVLCDQGRNCHSQGRATLCDYCATGDSHQCEFYGEHGITGLQGGLAEFISMPAVNCLRLPESLPTEHGAMVEPLGCVIHASDRVDRAATRYTFGGESPIRNILISGGGPAGLLFLQYLRNVKQFDGLIMVSDMREMNLDLVHQLGGTPINVSKQDIRESVRELTHGERVHYMVESCGNSIIFEQIPGLLRKQGTVLLYGHGHKGRDIGLLANVLFLEPTLVVPIGASGGFDSDGRPTTYRRALDLLSSGKVRVDPFVTHRYNALEEVHKAFEQDFQKPDYIKGVLKIQ
jgi:threonine dehydrogenase-like Zn-dependent dehydrogenase